MKTFILIFIHIFLFFSYAISAWGQVVEGKVTFNLNSTNPAQARVGDTLPALIEIWPADLIGEIKVSDLEGKTALGLFYILEVQEIERSSNNQDVLQIRADLTLTRDFKNTVLHVFEINGKQIGMTIEGLNEVVAPMEVDRLHYISIAMKKISGLKIILGILGTFFVSLVFTMPRLIKLRKKIKRKRLWVEEQKRNKELWKQRFMSAESRRDFEEIYSGKEQWISLIGGRSTPPIEEFLAAINRYQFKREWSLQETDEVKNYFEELRHILSE